MSELTSLKVSTAVRDRLAAAARARGITVRALLDDLSRQAADAALMAQVAEQMRHLREANPDAWEDYVAEGHAWEAGTVEHVDA